MCFLRRCPLVLWKETAVDFGTYVFQKKRYLYTIYEDILFPRVDCSLRDCTKMHVVKSDTFDNPRLELAPPFGRSPAFACLSSSLLSAPEPAQSEHPSQNHTQIPTSR